MTKMKWLIYGGCAAIGAVGNGLTGDWKFSPWVFLIILAGGAFAEVLGPKPLKMSGPPQTTFVYCPRCGYELVSGGLLVSDDGEIGVTYHCGRCHHISVWDFDSPAPVCIFGAMDCKALVHKPDFEPRIDLNLKGSG